MAESIAPNWSFERGSGNQPAHWSFYSWQESQGWWDEHHARSGRRSLGLCGLDGGWSVQVPVQPGKLCNVRFYYRAEGGPSRIVLYVRVQRAPRKWETVLYKPEPAIPANRRGQFVNGEYVGGADEKGWVLFEGGRFKVESGVESVNILVKLRSKDRNAKVWLDDFILTMSEPPKIPQTARLLRKVADGVVWTDSVNRKIFPDQKPPAGPSITAIELTAAQGEYESFQIAVTPMRTWRRVSWSWSNFKGPAPLPRTRMRCRRVETINIERPMGYHGHKGLNPDPLTDRLPCDVPAGKTQSLR